MTCVSAPPNLPSSSLRARAKPSRACFAPTEDVLDRLFMKAILTGAAKAGALNAATAAVVHAKTVARSLMVYSLSIARPSAAGSYYGIAGAGGRGQGCR